MRAYIIYKWKFGKMSIDGSWLGIFDSGRCGVVKDTLEQAYAGFIPSLI
jgi:hypothetical protein